MAIEEVPSVEEKRARDARLHPDVLLRNALAELEAGEIEIERCVLVIQRRDEDEEGGFDIRASGWHGEDLSPAIALLVGAQLVLARSLVGEEDSS